MKLPLISLLVAAFSSCPMIASAAQPAPQKTWLEIGNGMPAGTDMSAIQAWCEQPSDLEFTPKVAAASRALAHHQMIEEPQAEKRIRRTLINLDRADVDRACKEGPKP